MMKKLARKRTAEMGLNVIGTLRVLRMFYDKGLMDKQALASEIRKLRENGFWVSDNVIRRILENRPLKNYELRGCFLVFHKHLCS